MANKARSPEVIDFEKRRMSMVALDIIIEDGYHNLSMRKLAKKLNISTSTIYNYFKNSEEIYIYVLNKGFEMLFNDLQKAYESHTDPVEKLKSLCRAFFSFSVRERNLIFIMLILDVPKYDDYLGTEYEPYMRVELANAIKCRDIVSLTMSDMADVYPLFSKKEIARSTLIIINQLIGIITIHNNSIMKYLTEDIETGVELLLEEITRPFEIIRSMKGKVPDAAIKKRKR